MKRLIYLSLILGTFATKATAQANLQPTTHGAQYVIFTQTPGDKIRLSDVITFNITQKTDKDSVLASTYAMGHPVKLQVQAPESAGDPIVTGLMEVLPFAAKGDSLLLKVPADSILKGHEEQRPPFFPKGSHLNLYIKIVNVQTLSDAIAERNADMAKSKTDEVVAINKYIADNKLVLKTTVSGLKYIVTKTGLKPKPLAGDTVYVNYTGKLLNGKVFDSSIAADAQKAGLNQPGRPYEPIKFVVGQEKVIKGWDEGLLLLNEGSKAVFIVPSAIGYGDQGNGDAIPPFSPLAFNIELVKVVRIKHAPATVKKPLHHAVHHTVKKKS